MVGNEKQAKQQLKDKIKSYNKQRAGLAIVAIAFFCILSYSPLVEDGAFPTRLSTVCSAILLLCCMVFMLSFRTSLLLISVTTIITTVLLLLKQIRFELFLILLLINAVTVFITNNTAKAIIRSYVNENREIERMKAEATRDSLTQLLNRNGLEQAVRSAWANCKRDGKNAGVILADIDYFKSYNDTLGHLEGDRILKQVADCIKDCFKRETDIISRIGGDEFIIFLSDVNDDSLLRMAKYLSSSIIDLKVKTASESNLFDFLSVSMGIATGVPSPGDLLLDLYKNVDEELYRAKRAGRNCISFHEEIIQIGSFMDESFRTGLYICQSESEQIADRKATRR